MILIGIPVPVCVLANFFDATRIRVSAQMQACAIVQVVLVLLYSHSKSRTRLKLVSAICKTQRADARRACSLDYAEPLRLSAVCGYRFRSALHRALSACVRASAARGRSLRTAKCSISRDGSLPVTLSCSKNCCDPSSCIDVVAGRVPDPWAGPGSAGRPELLGRQRLLCCSICVPAAPAPCGWGSTPPLSVGTLGRGETHVSVH